MLSSPPPRSGLPPVDWLNVALLGLFERPLHVAAAGDEVPLPHFYWLATNCDYPALCDGRWATRPPPGPAAAAIGWLCDVNRGAC